MNKRLSSSARVAATLALSSAVAVAGAAPAESTVPSRHSGAVPTTASAGTNSAHTEAASSVSFAAAHKRARATVKIKIGSSHRVKAPATLRPGLVHVVNTGRRPVIVVRKKAKGSATFVTDFNKATNTKGSIRFHKDFNVVDVLTTRANAYVRLTKGTYYLADASLTKIKASQVRTLLVRGGKINARAPRSGLVRTASNGTVARAVSLPKRGYAHVVNATKSPHIVSIQAIRRDVTAQQIRDAIADPARHNPFALTTEYFAPVGQLAGHTDLYKQITAGAGRYFLFTASLTRPGLGKGQIGLLTVT